MIDTVLTYLTSDLAQAIIDRVLERGRLLRSRAALPSMVRRNDWRYC